MIRRLRRNECFAPYTRNTVLIESIVFPPRPIIDHISVGSIRRERSVPSSSCFSVISIAETLTTRDETMKRRNSMAFIGQTE